jgi:hypothetical protein
MAWKWMSIPFNGWSSVSGYGFPDTLLAEAVRAREIEPNSTE